jgi:hypothetical protein
MTNAAHFVSFPIPVGEREFRRIWRPLRLEPRARFQSLDRKPFLWADWIDAAQKTTSGHWIATVFFMAIVGLFEEFIDLLFYRLHLFTSHLFLLKRTLMRCAELLERLG